MDEDKIIRRQALRKDPKTHSYLSYFIGIGFELDKHRQKVNDEDLLKVTFELI